MPYSAFGLLWCGLEGGTDIGKVVSKKFNGGWKEFDISEMDISERVLRAVVDQRDFRG